MFLIRWQQSLKTFQLKVYQILISEDATGGAHTFHLLSSAALYLRSCETWINSLSSRALLKSHCATGAVVRPMFAT